MPADHGLEAIVSILMASCNNKQYLNQALEGVFGQRCSHPFVVIIADDASTDGSQELIREWAARHSNIIVAQQRRHCIERNFFDMFNLARTKYVAFCDGDDYWTNPDKLQRQIDFLEENPDFSVCTHKVDVLMDDVLLPPQAIYKRNATPEDLEKGVFHADEVADNYYFHVSSYVYRWRFPEGLPPWWEPFMINDQFHFLLHAAEGKIKYFHESMSVWRRHNNGFTWLQTYKTSAYIREKWIDMLTLLKSMHGFFKPRFHHELQHRVMHVLNLFLKECVDTNDYYILQHIVRAYNPYFAATEKNFGDLISVYKKIVQNTKKDDDEELLYRSASMLPSAEEQIPEERMPRPIRGEALPLDTAMLPKADATVWDAWTNNREYACCHNASSALVSLLWNLGISRPVYFPALCNPHFHRVTMLELKKRYYPVDEECRALAEFASTLEPDSIVLTTAYFGAPTSGTLRRALKKRRDVVWIEDRSHALFPGKEVFADYVLYSPAHVLGVPDGGIVIGEGAFSMGAILKEQKLDSLLEKMAKPYALYESPEQFDAREHFLQKDPLERLSRECMSRLTRDMLERIPMRDVISARKRNWRLLYTRLERLALWKIPDPDFAPYAFPLLLPPGKHASRLASFLADEGIVGPQRYGNYVGYSQDSTLNNNLFCLPCGHNLTADDMERMAEAVLRLEKRIWV